MSNSYAGTEARFQAAVKEGRWGDAAEMVRQAIRSEDGGWRAENADTLCDWLREGNWDDRPTLAQVAAEWDANTAANAYPAE